MADYHLKLNEGLFKDLFTEGHGLAPLLESMLNQVLEAQATERLGAKRYERAEEERQGYRNGYRPKTLKTRVGPLTLQVPQTRTGHFDTDVFKRYQRHEQGFVLGLMEMYVKGVSTRKVSDITEALCGTAFSKSTVSALAQDLDTRLEAWRNRSLSGQRYPFIIVDGLVVDIRRDEAIHPHGILIMYGINESGQREPLDLLIADSESEQAWGEAFKRLKARGLHGVDLVVSDAHQGLINAIKHQFQGVRWQRCQTHFMRNILGVTPRKYRAEIAEELKLIFTAENHQKAKELAKSFIQTYEGKVAKAVDCFEAGYEQALTVLSFPKPYRKRLKTTNLAERVNEEIRRRQRVIRIFPNEASALRLVGTLLADIYETWFQQPHYLNMEAYREWKQPQEEVQQKHKEETS